MGVKEGGRDAVLQRKGVDGPRRRRRAAREAVRTIGRASGRRREDARRARLPRVGLVLHADYFLSLFREVEVLSPLRIATLHIIAFLPSPQVRKLYLPGNAPKEQLRLDRRAAVQVAAGFQEVA